MPSMHIIPWSIFSLKTKINIIAKKFKKKRVVVKAGHYDQVWSKSDVGKYVKKTCCQKKKERKGKRVRYKACRSKNAGCHGTPLYAVEC